MRLGQILPIKHQAIFQALNSCGTKFADQNLLLIYASHRKTANIAAFAKYSSNYYYLGFKINRKFGKAVVRNRIKRRLRAICYQHLRQQPIPSGYIILIPRFASASGDFQTLKQSFTQGITKAVKLNMKTTA